MLRYGGIAIFSGDYTKVVFEIDVNVDVITVDLAVNLSKQFIAEI